jgi:hypothetical protein
MFQDSKHEAFTIAEVVLNDAPCHTRSTRNFIGAGSPIKAQINNAFNRCADHPFTGIRLGPRTGPFATLGAVTSGGVRLDRHDGNSKAP